MKNFVIDPAKSPNNLFCELEKMYGGTQVDNFLFFDTKDAKGQANRISLKENVTILIESIYNLEDIKFQVEPNHKKSSISLFYYNTPERLFFWCGVCADNTELPLAGNVRKRTKISQAIQWVVPANRNVNLLIAYLPLEWVEKYVDSDSHRFINNLGQLSQDNFSQGDSRFIDRNLISLVTDLFEQNKNKIIEFDDFYRLLNDFLERYNRLFTNSVCRTEHDSLDRLEEARAYLVKNLSEPVPSLKELCKMTGLNRLTFQTQFKERYGATFYQYYQDVRYTKAKELLLSKQYSVTQVAYSVNCRNLSHFAREFHRRFGMHPSYLLK